MTEIDATKQNVMPVLEGQRVLLRLACSDDIPTIISFYADNREHLTQFASPQPPEFYTASYWDQIIASRHKAYADDLAVNFFLFNKSKPREILGYANFFGIIRGAFHASYLGYGLAETSVGCGLMVESLTLAIRYMFEEKKLHRIMANHSPLNFRSARVLRRLGFVPEGYARDYLKVHGAWQDHVLNALTNNALDDTNEGRL